MGKRSKKIYHEQEIPKMLDVLSVMWPGNEEYMKHLMATRLAEVYGDRWKDHTKCLNCEASMAEYTYKVTKQRLEVLKWIAARVEDGLRKGKAFTDANQVHISGMREITGSQIDQKSSMRYLNLIEKVRDEDGTHKDSLWLITRNGWALLRGDPVRHSVRVWRGKIQERSERTITRYQLEAEGWSPEHYSYTHHEGNIL